jgi:hypothetical protein
MFLAFTVCVVFAALLGLDLATAPRPAGSQKLGAVAVPALSGRMESAHRETPRVLDELFSNHR